MGTMIQLSVGNLDIDWGKNRGFTDHSPIYQTGDVAKVPSWYVKDHESAKDDSWTLYAEYKEGYSSPLWKVIDRLYLLGYTLRVIQMQYDHDVAENNYENEPTSPTFEMLRQLFASCDVSMLIDDERQINRKLDKDFINHLFGLLTVSNKELAGILPHIFEGEYERIAPYTLLHLFSLNPNALQLPIIWDFDGLVESG